MDTIFCTKEQQLNNVSLCLDTHLYGNTQTKTLSSPNYVSFNQILIPLLV